MPLSFPAHQQLSANTLLLLSYIHKHFSHFYYSISSSVLSVFFTRIDVFPYLFAIFSFIYFFFLFHQLFSFSILRFFRHFIHISLFFYPILCLFLFSRSPSFLIFSYFSLFHSLLRPILSNSSKFARLQIHVSLLYFSHFLSPPLASSSFLFPLSVYFSCFLFSLIFLILYLILSPTFVYTSLCYIFFYLSLLLLLFSYFLSLFLYFYFSFSFSSLLFFTSH